MQNRIWFITGISGGLGKALAEAVMANGNFVVGTFRSEQQAANFVHSDGVLSNHHSADDRPESVDRYE